MKLDLKELLEKVGNEAEIDASTDGEEAKFQEDGLVLTQPVRINVHLTNTGTSVLMEGTFESEAELECARCLKKFRVPLVTKVDEEYAKEVPMPEPGRREIELREKDFVFPLEKNNILDIGEIIRQDLLLALPIKALCSPDCKGGT